ncbi:MAG: HEAT repeat domain-containing protein [Eudoraea sp.]|uniref:HEAT repeat domain-containing protein n=1 Tax=Eudoraea sp. TaxID=1979955 RepID=UPI003C74D710
MIKINLSIYKLKVLFGVPKIHTDLLWDLTFVFIGLGFLYFFFIFFFKRKIRLRTNLVSESKKDIAPMISTFLFHEAEDSKEEKRNYVELKITIRELLKEPLNKQVIAEVLVDLQKDVSGEARTRVYQLYQELELHIEAIKKLDSWRWEVVSKGILELTQMRVTSSYGFIKKFINDKRSIIRKQAQIAAVTLTHEGISFFLDTTRYKISEWQQLKLMEVLQNLEGFNPPSFKAWLTSNNRDVVLFSLRLIKHYHQIDAGIAMIPLVQHKNDMVKAEAIYCIKEFRVKEAMQTLKAVLPNCKTDIRIMILEVIATMGDIEDLPYLVKLNSKETNFMVKNKIHSVINIIKPGTIEPSDGIDPDLALEKSKQPTSKNIHEKTLVMKNNKPSEHNEESNLPKKEEVSSWDNFLDNEVEDEAIFNLCFKEELEDILNELKPESDNIAFLPLDFLPVVSEENELVVEQLNPETNKEPVDTDLNRNLNREFGEVQFQLELEELLEDIEGRDLNRETAENQLEVEASFIPLVTENDNTEERELRIQLLRELEVCYEEIVEEEDYFEMYRDLLKVEWLPKEEEEPVNFMEHSIDWKGITKKTTPKIKKSKTNNAPNTVEALITPKKSEPSLQNEEKTINCFSIFMELFRDSDKESKLILLDQVLAVGEEKELQFLKTLRNDKDKSVRKKAEIIHQKLEKMLLENEGQENDKEEIVITIDHNQKPFQGANEELDQHATIEKSKVSQGSTEEDSISNDNENTSEIFLDIDFDVQLESESSEKESVVMDLENQAPYKRHAENSALHPSKNVFYRLIRKTKRIISGLF